MWVFSFLVYDSRSAAKYENVVATISIIYNLMLAQLPAPLLAMLLFRGVFSGYARVLRVWPIVPPAGNMCRMRSTLACVGVYVASLTLRCTLHLAVFASIPESINLTFFINA